MENFKFEISQLEARSSRIPVGPVYPSKVLPSVEHPLLRQWLERGTDWVEELVKATKARQLEVFWSHRISEVDGRAEGGHERENKHPLKAAHPDWTTPASYWWQGMWNLAAEGLREHRVATLRELATQYDLDGIQIDFSRHVPVLPVGRQWELRNHVTTFLRDVRVMLLAVARERGRSLFLAVRIPQTLEGCRTDGFDVEAWAKLNLVDIMTLGTRSMDVHVEDFRALVGPSVQLQPCFDDHHTTDGYRYAPIEFLRGVFANYWWRGADSVMTFNWAVAVPEVARSIGGEIAPLTHQTAFWQVGEVRTLEGRDKVFAVERRGGYPWADGFFNRNDGAPLPARFLREQLAHTFNLLIGEERRNEAKLILRCILFDDADGDALSFYMNGQKLEIVHRDPHWKDAQIFSPKPQKTSGSDGRYRIDR